MMPIKWFCDLLGHSNGIVIGFAREPIITEKSNYEGITLKGIYLLRICSRCEEIYGAKTNIQQNRLNDMKGSKVLVRSGDITIFLELCAEGCPQNDLFFETVNDHSFIAGCNACETKTYRKTLEETIQGWNKWQLELKKSE
jgi:hypothetical protein